MIFECSRNIYTGVAKACRGSELIRGWQGLKKDNPAALESRHLGNGAVGICDFGEVHAIERGVECDSGFYFWKLNQSEVNLNSGCDERLKKDKKGGEANHPFRFIPD